MLVETLDRWSGGSAPDAYKARIRGQGYRYGHEYTPANRKDLPTCVVIASSAAALQQAYVFECSAAAQRKMMNGMCTILAHPLQRRAAPAHPPSQRRGVAPPYLPMAPGNNNAAFAFLLCCSWLPKSEKARKLFMLAAFWLPPFSCSCPSRRVDQGSLALQGGPPFELIGPQQQSVAPAAVG